MNLANKLTIFRMILVPVMVVIPFFHISGELWGIPLEVIYIDLIFIIAALTDKLDGYIARSRNQVTTFGKFLDPIADKVLVIAALIMLVEMTKLPAWIPIIIVVREFLVSGFRLIAVEKNGKVVAANIWGKIKTVTQMIAIIALFIDPNALGSVFTMGLHGFDFVISCFTTLMMSVAVIATIFSGWEYLKEGKELFQ